ncbi:MULTISPECIES: TetR/AcrR family transcriptional regulator [unclassified Blastococcus]
MADNVEDAEGPQSSWVTRAADRAPSVQNSRLRSMQRAQQIVDAARRLVSSNQGDFTTHQLVREAGIAIQTLYKHFPSKDHVMLAVLEDTIGESAESLQDAGSAIEDPVERLRFYVYSVVSGLDREGNRFIPAEHWRLIQLYPDEVEQARRPIAELFAKALQDAAQQHLIDPADVEQAAWFTNQLLLSTFHHHAFATTRESSEVIAAHLWAFLLRAYGGGAADPAAAPPPAAPPPPAPPPAPPAPAG